MAKAIGRKRALTGKLEASKRRKRVIAICVCATLVAMAAALVVLCLNRTYCMFC